MNQTLPIENEQNSWWALPDGVRDIVKDMVPDQETWRLECIKHESGEWTFSLPQFLTFNEALCNGTEHVIDWHYVEHFGHTPRPDDKVILTVSSEPPMTESYTVCEYIGADPDSPDCNLYYNKDANLDIWLCPYLQVLFKSVPKTLFVQFEKPHETD